MKLPTLGLAGVAIGVALLLAAACAGGGGEGLAPTTSTTVPPTDRPPPPATNTLALPEPTQTPIPPTPIPEPVVLSGFGQTATDPVEIPFALPVATFTHNGTSNFIVYAFQGGREIGLVANEIGNLSVRGLIELVSDEPVVFDVSADGAWTITIDEMSAAAGPEFSGVDDDVSGLFAAPESGAWEFSNDGDSNFIVYLHPAAWSDLAVNEIGPISGSTILAFDGDICFWEVAADGGWSLSPR